ncbi:hypothetical protein DERP_006576 [Dermatophagoides pteronyssinus]|uniref:C2H2-type domain-containing protein n=1 Tax=Dermatophagoides pteronyssinus TaxID=6956 RepID=A0ABQ8IQK9_DERPT|nr:hypothetical protein DERP_006576 [Dermatophagoides pteronyssinus]
MAKTMTNSNVVYELRQTPSRPLEKNPREFRKIMTKIFFVCFKHYHHYDELMVFIVVDMECSLKFDTSKQLLLHQRTHQPNRKHVCHICGYRFKEKFNLNRHQRIHTEFIR